MTRRHMIALAAVVLLGLIAAIVLWLAGGRVTKLEDLFSPWLEAKRLPDGTLPEAQLSAEERSRLVTIARTACEGKIRIPDGWPAFIERVGPSYVVTFPLDYSKVKGPTGDYYAQVTIEVATSKVIRIWGGR